MAHTPHPVERLAESVLARSSPPPALLLLVALYVLLVGGLVWLAGARGRCR
jgi:hypothetical protein